RWRIGSGDKIRVMYDPWLRGKGDRWVSSPQVKDMYHLVVKDLLLENYKVWDIAKIRNLFTGRVVDEIISTPLISSVKEDNMRAVGMRFGKLNLLTKRVTYYGATRECWLVAGLSQLMHNAAYQHGTVADRRHNVVPVEDPRPVRWEKPGVG
ncbi:hypothetical protein L195_g048568, partial [Trifolium pratense]